MEGREESRETRGRPKKEERDASSEAKWLADFKREEEKKTQ